MMMMDFFPSDLLFQLETALSVHQTPPQKLKFPLQQQQPQQVERREKQDKKRQQERKRKRVENDHASCGETKHQL